MTLFYLVAFIFAMSGWGMLPWLKFVKGSHSPLERFLIVQGLGITMSWIFIFILATLHVLNPFIIHLWIMAGFLIHLLLWRKGIYKSCWLFDLWNGSSDSNTRALIYLLAPMAFLAYLVFLYFAFAPTTTWDPLDYHYVLPREWLHAGGFIPLPKIMYSNFPASVELIWLIGMALHGDILANLLTWWMGVLTGLSILAIGKKWFSPVSGWIGLVLFLALPIIYTEEMPGGVIDLAVFTFNLLALHFSIRFAENEDLKDFYLGAIFAADSLAMKHSSLLTVLFIAIAIFIILRRKHRDLKCIKFAILFFILSFAFAIPWYIKSLIYTGNPVYPFLDKIFHPNSNLTTDILYWSNPKFTRGFLDWLTYWYKVVVDVGMVQFRFRLINGIYLGMLPLVYWAIKKPGFHRAFIAYSFFMIFLLIYQAPGEPRYMLAAWALLGVALGYGLFESGIMKDSTMRRLIPLGLIVPITIMLVMCVHENRKKNAFILGKEDLRSYYMANVIDYSLIDYMNTKTPEDSVVIWCDPRVYLFQRKYIPSYPFGSRNLPDWEYNDPTGILRGWKNRGVTHLGFTIAANYRAWVVAVILKQAYSDLRLSSEDTPTGYMYIENNYAPGYKYEENTKLMFSFKPMDRKVESLGPLTPRAMQLASYTTYGIDFVLKDGIPCYRADLEMLFKNRAYDTDVTIIQRLITLVNMGFLKPVKTARSEGILFEVNYEPLEFYEEHGWREGDY